MNNSGKRKVDAIDPLPMALCEPFGRHNMMFGGKVIVSRITATPGRRTVFRTTLATSAPLTVLPNPLGATKLAQDDTTHMKSLYAAAFSLADPHLIPALVIPTGVLIH
ncbi:hypothetical protein KCP77_16690 [Salmonella enterica subsp. enterica]|nr:hypothetical protein KCP77_16690 [Salmonella enterica subsp. enterica]